MSENIIGIGTRLSEKHTELLSSTVYQDEIDLFGDFEYLFSVGDLAHLLCLANSEVYEKKKLLKGINMLLVKNTDFFLMEIVVFFLKKK